MVIKSAVFAQSGTFLRWQYATHTDLREIDLGTGTMDHKEDDLFVEGVKRIKQLIQDKNLKQIDLANALGVSKKTVTQWLQNSATPNAQNLIELAKLLGVAERWTSDDKSDKAEATPSAPTTSTSTDLHQATVEQLMNEIKARYAALNLRAEISVNVTPIAGGFVTKD